MFASTLVIGASIAAAALAPGWLTLAAVALGGAILGFLVTIPLYTRFDTTIEGVAWVVTAYNAAVAVTALLLVFLVHRLRAASVLAGGLLLFTTASIACALAQSLAFLIAARCAQGIGAAVLSAARQIPELDAVVRRNAPPGLDSTGPAAGEGARLGHPHGVFERRCHPHRS